jgi:hypothetical protein
MPLLAAMCKALELFAGSYRRNFIPHSLLKRGIQWSFTQRGWEMTPVLSAEQQTDKNGVGKWESITGNKTSCGRRNQAEGRIDK